MPPPELDAEDFVITYLTGLGIVPSGQVAARMLPTPTFPFVLVRRVAGGDDWIVDKATIQVDSFDVDQTSASTVARSIHHAMRQLHAKTVVTVDGAQWNIYRCTTEQTPLYLEYQESGGGAVQDRYVARYILDIRLPAITGY